MIVVVALGCGAPDDCSAAGCPFGFPSSVTAFAPDGVAGDATGTLTVCVGDDCEDVAFAWDGPGAVTTVGVSGDDGDVVTAELRMADGRVFEAVGTLSDHRPNGTGCPPTCTAAQLQLEAP